MLSRLLRSTLFPYTTLFRSYCLPPVRTTANICLATALILEARGEYPRSKASQRVSPCRRRHAAHRMLSAVPRSEEHTSELQSHHDLVCRLLLEPEKPFSSFL